MSSPHTSSVRIEPLLDPSEMPALASIFDIATKASGDKFHEALVRYVENPYEETMKRLQTAHSAPRDGTSPEQHFVFKAVEVILRHSAEDGQEDGGRNPGGVLHETATDEKIVGMAHWTIGYIDLPKVDPFEQQAASASASARTEGAPEITPLEDPITTGGGSAAVPEPEPELEPFDFYTACRKPVRNRYISHIRGKKHVCKSYSVSLEPKPPVSTTSLSPDPSLLENTSSPFPSLTIRRSPPYCRSSRLPAPRNCKPTPTMGP